LEADLYLAVFFPISATRRDDSGIRTSVMNPTFLTTDTRQILLVSLRKVGTQALAREAIIS
ncbi:MAG: hypothetical protein WEE20_07385, partial [Bacteroidota bacterium]